MKLSLQMTMAIAALFALASFYVAFTGFASAGGLLDAQEAADARGFAWFWSFLGVVASAVTLGSWWLIRTGDQSGRHE